MKVYIASMFSRRAEMEGYADKMKAEGHEITASWVYGGETGLTRTNIAVIDLNDIDRSDVVVSFTHPRGTPTPGGGRHVEFGYALAKGKLLHLIGERENVFHHHENVVVFTNIDEWLTHHEVIA